MNICKKNIFNSFLFILFPVFLAAQNDTVKYDVSVLGVVSTGAYSPFWMNSKQHGKISDKPFSAGLLAGINKDYNTKKTLFNYGFKANALLQIDKTQTKVYFHELYAKARFSVFDFVVGAREDHLGNQDSTLSCGGFLFSQNARPMPKVTIGIEHFTAIPFTFGLLEVKGALSHGWFTDNLYATNVFLHHKYAYLKIGGKYAVNFQYGLDHVGMWGGIVPGNGQQPTNWNAYKTIFMAGSGASDAPVGEQINALGNHIISQSVKFDVRLSDFKLNIYWQDLSEDGPVKSMLKAMNRCDGLVGFAVRNKKLPYVKGFLYEFLNTTDQSGPYHDKDGIVYGGNDSYFSNYIYHTGWSYFSRTIGTPFIFPSTQKETDGDFYSTNNRVLVHHFGIEGDVCDYQYKVMTSFSKNYGTYSSPMMIENTSVLVEVNKRFPKYNNFEFGCSVGADIGKLYGNSVGAQFTIRKRGDLFHY